MPIAGALVETDDHSTDLFRRSRRARDASDLSPMIACQHVGRQGKGLGPAAPTRLEALVGGRISRERAGKRAILRRRKREGARARPPTTWETLRSLPRLTFP